MTAPSDATTEPTDDDRAHVPGDGDIWFFVVLETLIFTSYFCVNLWFRTQDEQAFLRAQSALDLPLGVLDTIILLTSSWTIARCVQETRAGRFQPARRLALITAGLGVGFTLFKVVEWVRLIGDGHTFTSSDFMQHFFFLTGIHAIHVLIGFVALGVLVHQLTDPTKRSQPIIETCSTYWHTVDLFWVLIFALLYVVR